MSDGEWSARWWRWGSSVPTDNNPISDKNPIVDTTGVHCAEGQTGKYGFWRKRSGAPPCVNAPSPEERIYSFQCSLLPSDKERAIVRAPRIAIHPLAQAGCRCGGQSDVAHGQHRSCSGQYLDQYRVTSPVFNVFLPQSNVVGIPAGTIGPVVSDGYWLLLTPLSPRGAYHPFPRQNHCKVETEATYQLNISR